MTFRRGSGSRSTDPYLWLMDPDPNSDPDKKFFCVLLFKGTFTSFFKDKKSKRIHKTVEMKIFFTIFAWWWKDPDPEAGGQKTCGSGGSGTLVVDDMLPCVIRSSDCQWEGTAMRNVFSESQIPVPNRIFWKLKKSFVSKILKLFVNLLKSFSVPVLKN